MLASEDLRVVHRDRRGKAKEGLPVDPFGDAEPCSRANAMASFQRMRPAFGAKPEQKGPWEDRKAGWWEVPLMIDMMIEIAFLRPRSDVRAVLLLLPVRVDLLYIWYHGIIISINLLIRFSKVRLLPPLANYLCFPPTVPIIKFQATM